MDFWNIIVCQEGRKLVFEIKRFMEHNRGGLVCIPSTEREEGEEVDGSRRWKYDGATRFGLAAALLNRTPLMHAMSTPSRGSTHHFFDQMPE